MPKGVNAGVYKRMFISLTAWRPMVGQYLDILENADKTWPPLVIPFLGVFVGTGKAKTAF